MESAEHGPGLLQAVAGLSLSYLSDTKKRTKHQRPDGLRVGTAPYLIHLSERENRHRDITPEWWTPARHGREGREETRVKTLEGQRKPIADHRATG